MAGKLSIESIPNKGTAMISEMTMKARKLAITTNIENISCERGFMSLKAVNAITIDFGQR
jgi:hypothetical protein